MKKRAIATVIVLITILGCSNKEIRAVREMKINHIDISTVENGSYIGEFEYGKYNYKVEVVIENGKIKEIKSLENRNSKYAKKAEGVLKKIVEEQRNDVDTVAGATTTSKALLKAVENAVSTKK